MAQLWSSMASRVPPDKLRVGAAFWLLGLINNVLYVIILSAALDLVGPAIPKGLVLLADVFPSVVIKAVAPYFIHVVPYSVRVVSFVIVSAAGMLLIALSPESRDSQAISVKLLGVALASLSSGGGELSFLGLTHFYGHISLASWASGTGAAGLVGAGAYLLATATLGLSSRTSLLAFSVLPLIMLLAFFVVLPAKQTLAGELSSDRSDDYRPVASEDTDSSVQDTDHDTANVSDPLLSNSSIAPAAKSSALQNFRAHLLRARSLFIPYMLPLLLVYIAEYTINQGVAPTLLFPLPQTPFHQYREFYPTYNAIYQMGVFISRSSSAFVRIHRLYPPSLLQVFNLTVLTLQSLFNFLPNVWVVFAIVFWEGLLGGLVYVNTFSEIRDGTLVPDEDKEFALSATTVSDSGGICIAALISMAFEKALCDWQVSHGRNMCRVGE